MICILYFTTFWKPFKHGKLKNSNFSLMLLRKERLFNNRLLMGALKMPDQKMQDLKMKDQMSGHENSGPQNEGPSSDTPSAVKSVCFKNVKMWLWCRAYVFTVSLILLNVHWADSDLFTRTKRIIISWFLYEYATIKETCACERLMCVPLQCLNKTLLCCDNLPTNYTNLHFPVLLLWSVIFRFCIFSPPISISLH